jgi:DNA polymerase-3 subunit epsilon
MKRHVQDSVKRFGLEHVQDWREVHKEETDWARKRIERRDFTIIDTETTGVNRVAEMIELAVVGPNGETVYDGLIRPKREIASGATATHGITEEDVADAPLLSDEWEDIQAALMSQPWLIIYNKPFDTRILKQSAYANSLPAFKLPKVDDLMPRFARWAGSWNAMRNGYRWASLDAGHRAKGDCLACVALMEKMARVPVTVKW